MATKCAPAQSQYPFLTRSARYELKHADGRRETRMVPLLRDGPRFMDVINAHIATPEPQHLHWHTGLRDGELEFVMYTVKAGHPDSEEHLPPPCPTRPIVSFTHHDMVLALQEQH